jgi:hypothetical protein
MRHLLVALLLVAALFDAVPVNALLAVHSGKPVAACCCRGVCHCRHCSVHHPSKPKTPAGACVLDCAGCSGSSGRTAPVPGSSTYDAPEVVALAVLQTPTAIRTSTRSRLTSHADRTPDPPPRAVIA